MEHSAVLMTPFVFTESSDEDEASGDEGLPDDESEVRDAMLHKCMYACMLAGRGSQFKLPMCHNLRHSG